MRIMFVGMALIAIVGAALTSCDGSGKCMAWNDPTIRPLMQVRMP